MKLTSFHLHGSRVFLAPIGPGFNVVHCPTGDRAATISDSLRAVLFGDVTQTGWPISDGDLVGSVDVTDEAGSGRVSRRRVGYGAGPLEVNLYDGRSPELTSRIQDMGATTGVLQIVDFGNGRELSEVAIQACVQRLESASPNRQELLNRERQLVDLRAELHQQREQPTQIGEDRAAELVRREHELMRQLESVPARPPLDSRLASIEAQVLHIETIIGDVERRLDGLPQEIARRDDDVYVGVQRGLRELRELAGALERQLVWVDGEITNLRPGHGSSELRRMVVELLDSISRQEQSLTVENLRLEAKQLHRCQQSLAAWRSGLSTDASVTLTPAEHSISWAHHRMQLQHELERVRRDQEHLKANGASQLTERLADLDRQLADTRRQLERSPGDAQPRVLYQASQLLSRVSEGELVTLRYDAPASTLFVVDYEGKPHASYDLPLDVQRLVALSLLLATADSRFPIVLDRVFEETPETATASILEVLRDACRDGMQILAVVYERKVADRLQSMQVDLRHADWAPPSPRELRQAAVQHGANYGSYSPTGAAPHAYNAHHAYSVDPRWPAAQSPRHHSSTAPVAVQPWERPMVRESQFEESSRIFEDSHRSTVQPEAHSHRHHLDYADSVCRIPYFGRDVAERLEQYGYWTVADFIRGDADEIAQRLRGDIRIAEIRAWQAQCQMMCGIARLRAFDAKILVACGISDPLQLQETDPVKLMRRVQAYLETPAGRQLLQSGTPFEVSRIQRWLDTAHAVPANGDGRTGRYARRVTTTTRTDRSSGSRSASRNSERSSSRSGRSTARDSSYNERDYDYDTGEEREFVYDRERDGLRRDGEDESAELRRPEYRRAERRSHSRSAGPRREGRSARLSASDEPVIQPFYSPNASLSGNQHADITTATNGNVMKFYLDMDSDVEAAPTIGPKTAELLYEIGIHTVGHLLEATPAEVAEQLGHKRISANNVLEWQLQSALVCRIPELRGHDAQILVAIGVTEPEQLAGYEPEDLYALVKPFANTKAGERIIRGGKAPDLGEVTEWIRFAKHARTLKAA